MTEREEQRLSALLAKKEAEEKAEKALQSKIKRTYGLTIDVQRKMQEVVKVYGQEDATKLFNYMFDSFLKQGNVESWKKQLHPTTADNDPPQHQYDYVREPETPEA